MTVSEKVISPGLASIYLEKNKKNRPVSKNNLRKLVTAMKDGEWQEDTGEAIKFDKDGNILDGQHRLMAIIESGESYNFLIIQDLPSKAFDVIDTGKMRNASDSLSIIGVKSYNDMSGIIRRYIYLQNDKVYNKSNETQLTSNTKVVEEYQSDRDGWDKVLKKSVLLYAQCNRILSKSLIGSWYKFLHATEPDECEVFFQKLCSGVGITDEKDPILVLRQMLIENLRSDKKMTQFAKNAYFIVTWNSFLQGKKYTRIPWRYEHDPAPKPFRTKATALDAVLEDISVEKQ